MSCRWKIEAMDCRAVVWGVDCDDYKAVVTHQPKLTAASTKTLLGLAKIKQVLDPWYLDTNTGDKIDPKVNQLGHDKNNRDAGLERLHQNHLHITAADSELGFARGNK